MAAPGTSGRAVSSAQPSTNHLASGVRSISLATFLTCSCTPLSPAALHRGGIGFLHLVAGPIRAALECTGILRTSAMQLGMLWIFGLLHLASRPGVYRRTEDISYAPWDAFDLWLCTPCRWACPSSFGVYRRIQEIWSAAWDALDLWLTAPCLHAPPRRSLRGGEGGADSVLSKRVGWRSGAPSRKRAPTWRRRR